MVKERMETKRKARRFLGPKAIAIYLLLLLAAALIGFVLGIYVSHRRPEEPEPTQPTQTLPLEETADVVLEEEEFKLSIRYLEELLQPTGELITTKYFYTDADVYENYKEAFGRKIPFTTDEVVFTYSGVVSIGIDLAEVSYIIDNEAKTVLISLPEVRIMANEIDADSFEYPYMKDSIFNATTMEDYTQLIATLKNQKAQEILADEEMLDSVRENTRQVMAHFLTASESTREYSVLFK